VVNALGQRITVHLQDKGRYAEVDYYRLLWLLQQYNEKIDAVMGTYEMYFLNLRASANDEWCPTEGISDYLAKSARLRLTYFWSLQRLQIERHLQGELYDHGFDGSMTKIIVSDRIIWLYNRAMDIRSEALRVGLPVADSHLQYH
jgi:hypothetical protein